MKVEPGERHLSFMNPSLRELQRSLLGLYSRLVNLGIVAKATATISIGFLEHIRHRIFSPYILLSTYFQNLDVRDSRIG